MYISEPYYISPSGYMHYVTCIGNRYMLLKLIPGTYYITYGYMIACMYIEIILYQPIWLCALCDLYWEQVHAAKPYIEHILCHL